MLRRPPIFPLTDTLFPYPTLFRSARPLFHRTDLSGADAPGDRSGASFPVHPQYRLLARLRSQATLRRRADTRAADGAFDPAALRPAAGRRGALRSEEHTSELQSLMRISYAVFCLKKKKINNK